jgi:SAM-dependent methyltransferase
MSYKIWIGSPVDVRTGDEAVKALAITNDSEYWGDNYGIIKVTAERWRRAQNYEQAGWSCHWRGQVDDRNDHHKTGFGDYKAVSQRLGHVLEVGCGPFTQLSTIMDGRTIDRVSLLDPLLDKYMVLPTCPYKDGSFHKHETTLHCLPLEGLNGAGIYDTIICVNVLEHVQDVRECLYRIHRALSIGGTLIFGERCYDGLDVNSVYDVGHPIRIKMRMFNEFEADFKSLYNVNFTSGDNVPSQEHYFIGEKVN